MSEVSSTATQRKPIATAAVASAFGLVLRASPCYSQKEQRQLFAEEMRKAFKSLRELQRRRRSTYRF